MRTGLGRGLDVLLGQPPAPAAVPAGVGEIPLERIKPNPKQPRRSFPADDLESLAGSIRRHGILQPIVVSREGDGYVLIAGHRRVLASRLAGKTAIPAVIRDDVGDRLELALIENVQRSDLNALDEARAYRLLMETYGLTQAQVGERVGKSQPSIANTLATLEATQVLQDAYIDGKITEGHLRALMPLGASQVSEALRVVLAEKQSVRQTEAYVARITKGKKRDRRLARGVDPDLRAVVAEWRAALGTKVEITKGRKGGRIEIEYYSEDDLQRLTEMLPGRVT